MSDTPVLGPAAGTLAGNWIVRGAYGNALALMSLAVDGARPRVSLLPCTDPSVYRLPESRIESVYLDENSVRFQFRLVSNRSTSGTTHAVDAYLPDGEARADLMRGSIVVARSRFPVVLERTHMKELGRDQSTASAEGKRGAATVRHEQGHREAEAGAPGNLEEAR